MEGLFETQSGAPLVIIGRPMFRGDAATILFKFPNI